MATGQIVSFNSLVLHPNPFIRAVETLGSLAGHTYKVLSQEALQSTTWVALDKLPSRWQKLALLIQLTVALPLTLLAMVAKFIWRYGQNLQIQSQAATEESFSQIPDAPDSRTLKSSFFAKRAVSPDTTAERPTSDLPATAASPSISARHDLGVTSSTSEAPDTGDLPTAPSSPTTTTMHDLGVTCLTPAAPATGDLPSASFSPSKPARVDLPTLPLADVREARQEDPTDRSPTAIIRLSERATYSNSDLSEIATAARGERGLQTEIEPQLNLAPTLPSHRKKLPTLVATLASLSTPSEPSTRLVVRSQKRVAPQSDVERLIQNYRRHFSTIPLGMLLRDLRLYAAYQGLPATQERDRFLTQPPARSLVVYNASERLRTLTLAQKKQWEDSSYAQRAGTLLAAPLQEADFVPLLREEANGAIFQGRGTYLGNLKKLRDRLSQTLQQEDIATARTIYLRSMVDTASGLIQSLIGQVKDPSLAQQLERDFAAIKSLDATHLTGTAIKTLRKLGAVCNIFDPHFSGNLPYYVGTRQVGSRLVHILRHPVPTIETRNLLLKSIVQIAPEYRGFVQSCHERGESILYNCLLKPNGDEKIRIERLLELHEQFPNTFHFVRFPLDGHLEHVDHFPTLQDYANTIADSLNKSLRAKGKEQFANDFIFSDSVREIVQREGECILRWAQEQIAPSELKDSDKKRALLCLFTSVLKEKIIQELGITFYNNSCKDAIDRGAVHLISDLSWHSFLTGTFNRHAATIREQTHWPAFMAKTQKVLSDRSQFILSFLRWIESMQSKQPATHLSYQKALGMNLGELTFAHQEVAESTSVQTTIDYYKNQKIEYRFNTTLYPLSQREDVLRQFRLDQIRSAWDPSVQAVFDYFQAEEKTNLSYALMQLLSQSVTASALASLMKTYQPLAILAPNKPYVVSAHYDEKTQKLCVQYKGMQFIVRNPDASSREAGKVQAYIEVDINFEVDEKKADVTFNAAAVDIPLRAEMTSVLHPVK